ncbi:hypothetical protein B296_00018481 [Ensete ventricosum]|uniref:Uncharacterized protein n=1 Tax=Ensete ventricosum TaxID=4639 RepID=A0A426Z2K1_ENSVE|nr:hypothetical protein B296_00018481 [Ensete ventricosum]
MVGSAEMVSMSLMHGNPRAGWASWNCTLDSGSSTTASVDPARRVRVSLQRVGDPHRGGQGCARGLSEMVGGDSIGQKKKDQRKSPHKADRATRGKGPADTSDEPPAPRQRPKSLRELCSARGVQPSRTSFRRSPRPRPHTTDAWNAGLAERGGLSNIYLRRVAPAADVRPVHSFVCGVDGRGNQSYGVGKSKLDEANGHRVSVEADLEKVRSESANLERQLVNLRKRLGDSKGQLRSPRAQVLQMETKLLDLARSKEALWEDLPKRAIEKYKESPGFEMGLVRMGRVSLEYGYQLALAQLQARHPGVEIELDPFVTLPEDVDVPMADEQPFDDSLPPPEE